MQSNLDSYESVLKGLRVFANSFLLIVWYCWKPTNDVLYPYVIPVKFFRLKSFNWHILLGTNKDSF